MQSFAKPAVLAALAACCLLASAARSEALEPVQVNDRVWAIVGETGQRSASNLATNATFGVILTSQGIVLVDAGGTAKGAAAIEAVLRKISRLPVVAVINSGGQDHRWLGNSYWKSKGARLISSKAAVADQRARFDVQWQALRQLTGDAALEGSAPEYADETFESELELAIGDVRMQLRHPGRAHTPGDLFVWLPEQRVAFAGDIVVAKRMLAILPDPLSTSADWIKAFDALAMLQPDVVVAGHGGPVSLPQAKRETRDYLQHLRESVKAVIDRKGSITDAARMDQSAFRHLAGADDLMGRNAQAVFVEMEFD
jgi:glyoxylase-like metal-dependent hydrolase (beta-lactamase superfamily II)